MTVPVFSDLGVALTAANDAIHALADALATDPGPTPPHTLDTIGCPGCAARCETPETHNWGCGCAPHGPGAAREIAARLADTGARSCLSADGGHVCLGPPCGAPAATLGEVLL